MLARRGRKLAAIIVLVALLVGGAGTAGAQQQGVAIDLGRIQVEEPLEPGSRYVLPTMRVRNPGTITTAYRMTIQPVASSGASADVSWFTFTPSEFSLEPDQRQPVEVVLVVPAGALAGDYEVLVSAGVAPGGEGARVGAAAAAHLSFVVADAHAQSGIPGVVPSAWLLVLVLAGLLLVRVAPRYRVRVERVE